MLKYHLIVWWVFPTLAILLTACNTQQSIPPTETPPNTPEANIPNPASAQCEEQGGKVEIRESEAGQYGICIFPDGSGCDEWALFHGVCKQGAKDTPTLEGITASYVNLNYGFALNPSEAWTIDDRIDSLVLKRPGYCLFIGFKPVGQALPLFRTGMPAGDFVDGGEFQWLGSSAKKNLLVYEDQTMLVDFCQQDEEGCLIAGDLNFVIWLEPCTENAEDYPTSNIPVEEIIEAQKVVESLTLLDK
jgi:putative hemolysin